MKAKVGANPTAVSTAVPWQHGDDGQGGDAHAGSGPTAASAEPGHASPPGMVS